MSQNLELLAEIAARASTFDERLQNGCLIPHPERNEGEIDKRLERWRDRAAKGDSALFEELLAMRGLNVESVRKGLGRVKLADEERIPEWAAVLPECLAAAKRHGEGSPATPRFCDEAVPLPFEQILAPFVETAVGRLRQQTGKAYIRLAHKAHAALERMLLAWLTGPCSSALMLEFSLFRLRNRPEETPVAALAENSSGLYGRFAGKMLRSELAGFLGEYSVLARAIATIMEHWVSAVAEFLERLDSDWDSLAQVFHQNRENRSVTDLKAGLSDPHHGGRTVLALSFDSGLKVVYKPKCLDTELVFGHLLDWINKRAGDARLRSPEVLVRTGYGWVEYLEHIPCKTEEQLTRFYHRGGMLLALFHVLDATDVHAENLIAVEEFPMLVDAETLITPQLGQLNSVGEQRASEVRALWNLNESVLKTGMLPNWRRDAQKGHCDLSALGGVGGEELETPVWIGAHTDDMERRFSTLKVSRNRNVPFPPEQSAEPGRFVEEIVAGFEEVYKIISENRDALAQDNGPIELLSREPMRLVFRETQTYFNILKKSFDPTVLRDGADRSVDLEVLSRILCISQPRSKHLPLVEVEKRSLENLDIPAFTTFPSNCTLNAGRERIVDNYFSECGYARVLGRIRELSPEHCAEQVAVIRGSFYAKILTQRRATDRARSENTVASDELLSAAIEIGERLEKDAIPGEAGSASWVGVVYKPEPNAFRYLPLGEDLMEGQAGVAIFLAALARETGKAGFRDLAAGAMVPMRRLAAFSLDESGWKKVNDGRMESALSIYSLVRAGQLLDDDSLIAQARKVASLVTPDLLARSQSLGLPNGVTPILLGLLALCDVSRDDCIWERAILCGDYLLQQPERGIGSHYAFKRLYERTGEGRFCGPQGNANLKQWLPGLLGIGLDLLWNREPGEEPISTLLEASLIAHCRNQPMRLDSVLEGNFGLVELAAEAAGRLSRPELLTAGKRLAAESVRRAQKHGGYQVLSGIPPAAASFGYLRGVAGIGYTLLRTCAPELPSILQWT